MSTLYYVMDPMCSWCWAFEPVMQRVRTRIGDRLHLQYIMGGLAPDSDEPMPLAMRNYLQDIWHYINRETGAEFNFEFWERCQPKRSTYPACRAVIAAGLQGHDAIPRMIRGIQEAYYLQARNPSEPRTLIEIAESIGLDPQLFAKDLRSAEVDEKLQEHIRLARSWGIDSFPALLIDQQEEQYWLARGYTPEAEVMERLEEYMEWLP